MESTVTTKPERGSADYYADLFRRTARDCDELRGFIVTLVEDVATAEIVLAVGKPVRTANDTERLERIRNIVAAGSRVLAELEARR